MNILVPNIKPLKWTIYACMLKKTPLLQAFCCSIDQSEFLLAEKTTSLTTEQLFQFQGAEEWESSVRYGGVLALVGLFVGAMVLQRLVVIQGVVLDILSGRSVQCTKSVCCSANFAWCHVTELINTRFQW